VGRSLHKRYRSFLRVRFIGKNGMGWSGAYCIEYIPDAFHPVLLRLFGLHERLLPAPVER
jgi:hypothetical protein